MDDALPPEAAQLTRDGSTIGFETLRSATRAPASGATLVLLHGFGTSRRAVRALGLALLGAGRHGRLLALDLRGHGATPAATEAGASYPAMRDDLLALLAAECPNGADLVGHSMGGQVSLMAAIAEPQRARSLVTIGAGPCRAVTEAAEHRSWERAAGFFEKAAAPALANALADAAPADAATHPELAPERLYAGARGVELARVVRGGFLHVESNDEACRTLDVPTLVLAGDGDEGWLAPSRKLAELVPHARLVIVPGGGHHVYVEQAEACAREITKFWNELGPQTRR